MEVKPNFLREGLKFQRHCHGPLCDLDVSPPSLCCDGPKQNFQVKMNFVTAGCVGSSGLRATRLTFLGNAESGRSFQTSYMRLPLDLFFRCLHLYLLFDFSLRYISNTHNLHCSMTVICRLFHLMHLK